MATKIKIKRGLKANLPTLSIGEMALCTDNGDVYIGTGSGNYNITNSYNENLSQMCGVTNKGGFFVYFKAGEDLVRGNVVMIKTGVNSTVIKADYTQNPHIIGVVHDDTLSGNNVRIIISGTADVLFSDTTNYSNLSSAMLSPTVLGKCVMSNGRSDTPSLNRVGKVMEKTPSSNMYTVFIRRL